MSNEKDKRKVRPERFGQDGLEGLTIYDKDGNLEKRGDQKHFPKEAPDEQEEQEDQDQ